MNRKVDIREDVKRYQETLSYASSKVDYSVGENLFMLPSNMQLRIRWGTVGYDNKILVSDKKFNLGKNDEVNLTVPAIKSHTTSSIEPTTITHAPAISQKNQKPITHNKEKIALVLALAGGFAIWNTFRRKLKKCVLFFVRISIENKTKHEYQLCSDHF